MEGFQIKADDRITDLFEIISDNISSDDEFPVFLASPMRIFPGYSLPETVLIKKISDPSIYQNLLKNDSPYIETIYGICATADGLFAICGNVTRPSCFSYKMYDALYNKAGSTSLSLDDLIDADHFPCFNIPRQDDAHFICEHDALILLEEIIDGLSSFSKAKMVHGDLSPQNILLADTNDNKSGIPFRPVIIDFGISKPFKKAEHQVTTIVGTKEFAAPEIMSYNKPTDRVDIYSLGCLLHFMILGKAPGENRNGLKDSEKLLNRGVYHIIKKCNADYEVRYHNLKELKKAIHHELNYRKSSMYRLITSIPGFRTHRIWKMVIATYTYLSLLTAIIAVLVYGDTAEHDNVINIIFCIIGIICVFDAFNIKRFFPKYVYFRERWPIIGHLVRIGIAVIVIFFWVQTLNAFVIPTP